MMDSGSAPLTRLVRNDEVFPERHLIRTGEQRRTTHNFAIFRRFLLILVCILPRAMVSLR
ncbi:hypothetical protein BOSEA31B_10141 [Hyphomicrobiales bacterium]|nr:hypothetical protein BOSEA31B_10141 [Hyphomicrobiales bacterium]CAH1701820.1 hypothetical protein BOSEA1005_21519 [Hyphomicrobiales bacterium]CAI0345976.1 hypothetical protein BO1005MUT1_470134 [Hyphomicrobiales bacterium]